MHIQSKSRLMLVDMIAYVVLTFSIGLATSLTLAGAVLLLASGAQAQEITPMKPTEAKTGTLLLKSSVKGETFAAPLQSTEVTIRVSGIVARAQVRQIFRNPHKDWYEGIYVFPLPENAAVDHLQMKIGERVVLGVIREKQAAKAAYEQAKSNGQRAALLEQERPNMFTSSVANIGPSENIVIELEYQQTLRYDNGRYSMRFPTVVGPRYVPGTVQVAGLGAGTGWGFATNIVPDAGRITPPVLKPHEDRDPVNPMSIKVELDAGVPLAAVDSPYHPVKVKQLEGGRHEVTLEGRNWATRDFELAWTVAPTALPRPALFTEKKNGKTYSLLMLMPPTAAAGVRLPREVIFVIDTSGSMSGTSIAQAKEALALAIERLGVADRFNVIEFNSYAQALFPDARTATNDNRSIAANWVRNLRAQGGTEMALALNLALNGKESPDRVRQVVFLTDGAVGNEDQLFKLISDKLGDSRLFTVGIGSAPNSHFMTKAAQAGRGTYTYIGKIEEVKDKMSTLFAKLESPVLKGVQITWPEGARVESWPRQIPDLYLGEPIVVTAVLDGMKTSYGASIKLTGLNGATPWQAEVPLADANKGEGMGILWARDKIDSLINSMREGAKEEDVKPAVIDVALTHHLVSKYTSLVAIDRAPARGKDEPLKTAALPINLPDGANHAAIFGELPQGATDARFNLALGMLLMLLATAVWQVRRRVF